MTDGANFHPLSVQRPVRRGVPRPGWLVTQAGFVVAPPGGAALGFHGSSECYAVQPVGDRLAGAVRSVLEQTERDLEVIIVDDGSEDGTPEVVARLHAEDSRVHGVRLRRSAGAAMARSPSSMPCQGEARSAT